MELNYKIIGTRVKEIRTQKQISQACLAEKINMSVPYISHIETARRHASLKTLLQIAHVLETTVDNILVGNQPNDSVEYLAEITQLLENCSNYEKRVVYEIAVATKRSLNENSDLR